MNASFLAVAALLLTSVLALLLRPLLRRTPPPAAASWQGLNISLYRDQLAELECDRDLGHLSEADFRRSQTELQRRLLQETFDAEAAAMSSDSARGSAAVLIAVFPLAAALLYFSLGSPASLAPQASVPQPQQTAHQLTQARIEQMVEGLAARLQQHPDDTQGWVMLARSYMAMRRFDDAVKAFGHLGDAVNGDTVLLTEYADLLGARAGGNLDGKPTALVEAALKLDPQNAKALWLAGTAAFNRADYAVAERYWRRLLRLLPPNSPDAGSITAAIAETRAKRAK